MRTLVLIAVAILAAEHAQSATSSESNAYEAPYFSGLGHTRDWDPKHAKDDASADISQGKLKLHLGDEHTGRGGIAGVPFQLYDLLKGCRFIHPGFTDVISGDVDDARRNRQYQYARIYNQEIVRFLLTKSGRKVSELEEKLADKDGEERALRVMIERRIAEIEETKKRGK